LAVGWYQFSSQYIHNPLARNRVRVIVDADNGVTGYLFSSDHHVNQTAPHVLTIPPHQLLREQQTFLLRRPVSIDLRLIELDLYQVHLVQDFWSDDDNPNLTECLACIFLGRRRRTGEWETPEHWPIECRSLVILGMIDTRQGRYEFSAHHEYKL
jgi:hypothetical protein